jgi:hypothetical protein
MIHVAGNIASGQSNLVVAIGLFATQKLKILTVCYSRPNLGIAVSLGLDRRISTHDEVIRLGDTWEQTHKEQNSREY